jgi:hypothetical protein
MEGKGRAFRALSVATVMADALWEMGVDSGTGRNARKHDRPVYAVFAGSEGELRPFVANLLTGRPAVPSVSSGYRRRGSDAGYEFMKSVGYKVSWQRHEEGSFATVYLPDLVALDPGMVDPKGIKFVVIPGEEYLRREAEKMPVDDIVKYAWHLPVVKDANEPEKDWRGHVVSGCVEPLSADVLSGMVPLSYLFSLYLSNRSRAPMPPDGRFYLQLLLACLKQGLASLSTTDRDSYGHGGERFGRNASYKFAEEGLETGHLAPGLAFMANHEEIEALLAAECETYFKRTEGKR